MRFGPLGLGLILAVPTVVYAAVVALPFFAPPSERPPGFTVFWVVFWSSFLLVDVWWSLSHARVDVDGGEGTLTLARVRWPLREQRRTFSLSRILDAAVPVDDDPEDALRYTLVLVVEGEGDVALLGQSEVDPARLERLAAAIRAALPGPPRAVMGSASPSME
jgi:hypothetical protein